MVRSPRSLGLVVALSATVAGMAAAARAMATTTLNLLPGTAAGPSQNGGGRLSSTSSRTNTFSPAAYADYKRFGGEPTGTVDRFPLTSGTLGGTTCTPTRPCYPDFAY